MDEINIAWAAGLFEGEGCFSYLKAIPPKRSINMIATVTSTDLDILERFSLVLGYGTIHENWVKNKSHKACFKWQCSGEKVLDLYKKFLPYLGKRRIHRFNEILSMRIQYENSSPQNIGDSRPKRYATNFLGVINGQ